MTVSADLACIVFSNFKMVMIENLCKDSYRYLVHFFNTNFPSERFYLFVKGRGLGCDVGKCYIYICDSFLCTINCIYFVVRSSVVV
jgi:hypothetical protein